MSEPIKIHPHNKRIFEFRGRSVMLLCATEHYGAVMNRPFDFEKYLADAYEKKQTLTRLFILFRELQSAINPHSTCKPESPDYISPYKRTGPGKAQDCELKYDLDQWNEEFFERLRRFISLASEYGIIVEVTLLSNTYSPEVWALNPLNAENNINGTEKIEWPEYMSQRHPALFRRQLSLVGKVVEQTNAYDNVIYEICNEPGGNAPGIENSPSPSEVNQWQKAIAGIIRETESKLPNRHLISGSEAFIYHPWEQTSDIAFKYSFITDIVNIHPLPNTTYGGKSYDMGVFMSKQLKLRNFRDYCMAAGSGNKPLNMDEDNVASRYKDYDGWTIHRKRAWTALFCGCHYDYIDFTINIYLEAGTPESQKNIRSWFSYLSEFINSIDITAAKPAAGFLKKVPEHVLESVIAVGDKDICIYLADERELDQQGAGSMIKGGIAIDLPEGHYEASCFSPVSGLYSPATGMFSGGNANGTEVILPGFVHDMVVRIRKK